jgi:hypothetical protein
MFQNDIDMGLLISFGNVECPDENLDDRGIEDQLLTRAVFVFFYSMSRPAMWANQLPIERS